MPYDPSLPLENTEIDAVQMRGQLNGLKELIDALPSVTGAQVDSVTTLDPGQSATVSVVVNGQTLHFTFAIPRGVDGAPGTPGSVITGAQVDSVSSVNPVDPASASASYDGSLLHFSFSIPRGIDGANGAPGEVSNATLDAAIAGTSGNSNGVGLLNLVVSDPPTQGEMQALVNKVDELILALRRP